MRTFWTDGSAVPNPGLGGYAVLEGGKPVALGREENSTNIRMEAQAILAALRLAGGEKCEIRTDSEFWIKVLTEWAPGWKANGWRKKSRGEIANLELVKEVFEEYERGQVELVWVRGHVGTADNELADEWAGRARNGAIV